MPPEPFQEHWAFDGDRLLIRPIRPSDAVAHDAFFRRLTPEDIRLRFFAAVRELTAAQLKKFTRLDCARDMALIAVREATGETVAVARLAREPNAPIAEFAVIVQRDEQHRGLATHLLRRLLEWAPQHGVREVVGQILAENTAMRDLARHLGFRLHPMPADPAVIEARLVLP